MMASEKQSISREILYLIDWLEDEVTTEYERGMVMGLRMAECLAEVVEGNSDSEGC